MQVSLDEKQPIKVEYGDVVRTERGTFLIVSDYDYQDCYAIDLANNKVADCGFQCSVDEVLGMLGTVLEVIKSDELELRRKYI